MPRALAPPRHAVCRPHWWEILLLLKRSMGMPVKEIASRVGMSYMGVRQHLDSMEAEKLIESSRRAQKVGRPEKLYRLTPRGQSLFEQGQGKLLAVFLDEATALFDSYAPEKLLLQYFERLQREMAAEIDGRNMLERATALAACRTEQGYHAVCLYDKEAGLRIEEYHHPLRPLVKRFPALVQHEKALVERLLGTAVKRSETSAGTHHQVRWSVPTM